MMNERIYELAEQAGAYCEVLRGGDYKPPVLDGMNLEKFAELIVAECSKVIVNGGYRNPALGEKHPLTPPEIATMIREHFGVEE